jgi:drug/metabolite transporter (DMT)-like permease
MSWLVFAFSGPVLWAVSTHLDKYLVEQYFKHGDAALLLVFTAFAGVLALPFIALHEPTIADASARSIALIVVAGILYMGALFFYLRALQSEEASVVAPFFQSAPLFGYVLAYFVLGERLSAWQMGGGAMIIAGTLFVSVRFPDAAARGGKTVFKLRLVTLMLAFGFIAALSGLIFKFFAVHISFWTTTFWMFVGQTIFGAAQLTFPSYRRQLAAIVAANTGALIAVSGINELIGVIAMLGYRYALVLAPLSLVQAIGSTTTLFVVVFGVALNAVYPRFAREPLSVHDLLPKTIAAVLVAAGVALATH